MRMVKICGWCAVLLTLFTACEEKEFLYNDPTNIVMFNETNALFHVVDEKTTNEINITISSPVVSDKDREYLIGVKQTGAEGEAVQGKHFELKSTTVVIPAGERFGEITVIGYSKYLSSEEDFFVNLTLVDASEGEVAAFNNIFTLYLSRVCEFSMDKMIGTYKVKSAVVQGEFEFRVVQGDKPNELLFLEPYSPNVDFTVSVNQSASGEYQIVMENQKFVIGTNGSSEIIEMWATGSGTWNTCTKILKLVYHPYDRNSGIEYLPITEIITKID